MITVLLAWFPVAVLGAYVLSVAPSDIKNPFKRLLYHVLFWPNTLLSALQGLYGRQSYRFPRIAALTAWFKA